MIEQEVSQNFFFDSAFTDLFKLTLCDILNQEVFVTISVLNNEVILISFFLNIYIFDKYADHHLRHLFAI